MQIASLICVVSMHRYREKGVDSSMHESLVNLLLIWPERKQNIINIYVFINGLLNESAQYFRVYWGYVNFTFSLFISPNNTSILRHTKYIANKKVNFSKSSLLWTNLLNHPSNFVALYLWVLPLKYWSGDLKSLGKMKTKTVWWLLIFKTQI